MNDSADKHTPTDEFVEYLARDTMRRLRYEARFAPAPSVVRSPWRIPKAFAIAAGVVMTLSTGMVLGASANYASAAVLPNGTTTIPSRPTLAILPIKNALTAIGCTQPAEHAVATTATASTSPENATSVNSASTGTAAPVAILPKADVATLDQTQAPAASVNPDRAMVASLTRQHQAAVVRGDTASQFIVMVLDASQNYLWSTHGNGNLSVEVGGDPRTAAERAEYNRANAAELRGRGWTASVRVNYAIDSSRSARLVFSRDTMNAETYRYYRAQVMTDSNRTGTIRPMFVDSVASLRRALAGAVAGAGGGRGGAGVIVSSDSTNRRYRIAFSTDTLNRFSTGYVMTPRTQSDVGCGNLAVRVVKRSGAPGNDSTSNVYSTGFMEPRFGLRCNQAAGLQERGAGESGVIGLASNNVAKADLFLFAAGELAPRDLKVMVVYLTPGTVWSGR